MIFNEIKYLSNNNKCKLIINMRFCVNDHDYNGTQVN